MTVSDTGGTTLVDLGDINDGLSGLVGNSSGDALMAADVFDHGDRHQPDGFRGGRGPFRRKGPVDAELQGGPPVPVVSDMTVYYETLDTSGAAPVDYQSTYGPRRVTLAVTYDSATGTYTADGTIPVQTNAAIYDGGQGSVQVELLHPSLCQLATATAAATVQHRQLGIAVVDVTRNVILAVVGPGSGPVSVQLGEKILVMGLANGTEVAPTQR